MIYVASLIVLLIGIGLIRLGIRDSRELGLDIAELKKHSLRKNRMKIMAEVVSLEINTDYPFKLLDWPYEDDFEENSEYKEALIEAEVEYFHELSVIDVFGNSKIEYRYIAPDGHSYLSRTVSRIPDDKNINFIYKLKVGQKIPAYLNPDDYSDSLLKSNTNEQFERYTKITTKQARAKMVIGSVIIVMAVISPFSFTMM